MSADSRRSFAETLASLPSVAHVLRLELYDAAGDCAGVIENRPGSAGSVAVYHAVAGDEGRLDNAAAERALQLYAEHTADATAHPGKHPNIDRLLRIVASNSVLNVRVVTAQE